MKKQAGTYEPSHFKGQGWYLTFCDELIGGPYADWSDVTTEMINQCDWGVLGRVYLDKHGKVMDKAPDVMSTAASGLRELAQYLKD